MSGLQHVYVVPLSCAHVQVLYDQLSSTPDELE